MIIRGIQKVTLLDYPGRVACTLFTGGCNFRCPFCQNSELVLCPKAVDEIPMSDIFAYLNKRKGLLESLSAFDGVDVEQTMQDIINSLQSTETQISTAVDQSRELLGQILRLQSRAAECDLLKSRYAALRTQYISDVKRLSFIVNGEVEMGHVPKNQVCP